MGGLPIRHSGDPCGMGGAVRLRTLVRSARLAGLLGVALPAVFLGTLVGGLALAALGAGKRWIGKAPKPSDSWLAYRPPERCACGYFMLGANLDNVRESDNLHTRAACTFGVDRDD